MNIEILESYENTDINDYYIVIDKNTNRKYVVMHIINGKYSIYDHEYHPIISLFKWYPNNGYACSILRTEHLEKINDLPYTEEGVHKSLKIRERMHLPPFELNRQIFMHILIKAYILKEPKFIENKHDEFRTVFHHINGWNRDNRIENIMWIGRYEQLSIFKIGKLFKPPVEVRHLSMELPKYVKWINAKRCYRIDEHPVIFRMVKEGTSKHKYITSHIGKKTTPLQKYTDVMEKYEKLQNSPYYHFPTYINFLETMEKLKEENKEILECIYRQKIIKVIVNKIFTNLLIFNE
jgi:hypothetical protein